MATAQWILTSRLIIASPAVYAGISVFPLPGGVAGIGITAAGGPSTKIVLRGLTINGQGGTHGILVGGNGAVYIEDCVVSNLSELGIFILDNVHVVIDGTVLRGNGTSGLYATNNPNVRVSNSRIVGNGNDGVLIGNGIFHGSRLTIQNNGGAGIKVDVNFKFPADGFTVAATLTDSVVTGNGAAGIDATNFIAGVTLQVVVADSAVVENGWTGLFLDGATTATVTGSTLARNAAEDLAILGSAVLRTSANNALTGRGAADINGTLTPNPLK